MHTYKEEIQLNGRNGDIVNAEASIHPEKDAQIPERVLDDLWKIIKAINLEDAVTIASLEAAISSTMTPQLVTSRIIHVELEFYCPLYPGEDVFPSESLYPVAHGSLYISVSNKLGKIRRTPQFGTFKHAQKVQQSTHEQPELGFG